MKEQDKGLVARIARLDEALLDYYERKNRKELRDPESGIVWQKRQGTSQVYDDAALKKLLKRKGIPVDRVFKKRVVVERDDKEIYKMLQAEVLTLDDIEEVSELVNHKPYIVGLNAKANNKSNSTPEAQVREAA